VGSNLGLAAPAASSRYCRLSFKHPVPSEDVSGFLEAVLQFARQNAIELIVPVTDWTVLPFSKYRRQFEGVCRLALGPHSALGIGADKFQTVSLARELQIRVPETSLVRSRDELDGAFANFSFPVVVKDRFSARWEGNGAILGSVAYAYSKDDLRQKVANRLQQAGDVLVQEFVPGEGMGFSSLATEQGVFLPFMWSRLRETDPRGSGSSASESIPLAASVQESSTALVKRLGLQGVSMVEFKRPRTGEAPVLMEINPRPWGSIQLPISCGVDYPVFLVDWLLSGRTPPRQIEYQEGITCRRLTSELTHLEHTLRGAPAGWPMPYPGFLRTLLDISVPWYPGMRYSDFWFRDPVPGYVGLARWVGGRFAQAKPEVKPKK
jgi:predicted ATP-grasp superfamily ATP-dependent carboligase